MACLLLACWVHAATAAAPDAPLRVVTHNNYPPYAFLNAEGRAEGYIIDLWRLWEQKTGIRVDLQPMQWSAAQQAMRDGRADVIDMMFRTAVREQLYDFSEPYAKLPAAIYVDKALSGIHDPASLKGFVIGVELGDACIDQLASHGIGTVRTYPDYRSILAALHAGEIRLFCMDDAPASYYLQLQRLERQYARAFILYTGELHWAVAKGDSANFALVSRGMAGITDSERAALSAKWLREPLHLRSDTRLLWGGVAAGGILLLLALLWIRSLRHAVRQRSAAFRQKSEQLEQAAAVLAAEQGQLRLLFESTPDAMALKDRHGVYVHCNGGVESIFGMPRDRIIGNTDAGLFQDAGFRERARASDRQVLDTGRVQRNEETVVAADGREWTLEIIKVPIKSPDGEVSGVLSVARDISERRRAERELQIAAVAFEAHDGMLITDDAGRIERVNTAFTHISGFAAGELLGRTPSLLKSGLHDDAFYEAMWRTLDSLGYWTGEIANRHRNGRLYSARLSITAVCDAAGRTMHYVGCLQDISGEKQARALAEHLSRFDPLTELPNRASFTAQLEHALGTSAEDHAFGALLMLDLDHFQRVNDSLGHATGDHLLREVAQRLQRGGREQAFLGRFSGDTFVLLCERLGPDLHAAASRAFDCAEAARTALASPFLLGEQRVACSASIGITLYRGARHDVTALLRRAELAMYRSKQSGRNCIRFFEEHMQSELDERNWMDASLHEAVQSGQLELHYQIQVDRNGKPTGAEALMRWRHPVRGTISPAVFIPLAEDSGLIVQMGKWALAECCDRLAGWRAHPLLGRLTLAVNISPRQFREDSFVADILAEVRRSGAAVERLKLEVTESLAIDDFTSSIGKLNALRECGFSISLDDFGTGNSSLNYLTKLPLTQLKIDKSFVDELPDSHRDAMVAQTIIAMGQGLGLDVIAEGVENAAQHEYLVALGCQAFQGYLFGRPLPLEQFEALCASLHNTWEAQ